MEKLYLQLTSGRGPRECAYVVAQLLNVIRKEAQAASITCTLLEGEVAEGAGPEALMSATLKLEGYKVQSFADQWLGTIQWIGVSPYRPTHKRRNWFVGVACVPICSVQNMKLSGGITIETMRASGPGGQNVNKTNSAVRATHAATGLSVTARESRSQTQNRKMAERKLETLFQGGLEAQRMQDESVKWAEHQMVERGNPRRIFRGQKFTE